MIDLGIATTHLHTVVSLRERRDWKRANDPRGGIGGVAVVLGWPCPRLVSIPVTFDISTDGK